jgi:predicted dehydrogenase
MDKVKVAVVGLGGIAQIAHLPILAKMQNVEIAAVCDIEKAKAKGIAAKYNVKSYYTDLDVMLAESELNAVCVASPTSFHNEHAIKIIEKGLDALVEKPLARNFEEASAIVDAAKKYKTKLMVGMNSRFRPDMMMQETFISAKELGDIFYIKAGFLKKRSTDGKWSVNKSESGGGVFMDLGIVMLDISLWLLNFPKTSSVSAVNYYQTTKDVEDSTFVFIRFENGSTVSLESSWNLHRENDLFYCNVYGTEGSASINPLRIYKKMHGALVNVTPLKMEKPANIFKRSYEYEIEHFIKCVANGTGTVSSGVEALERMKIVDAVYKSAKSGKEVVFK